MVGLPFDCLANPVGAVRLTFEKAVSSGLDPPTSDGRDWGDVRLFRQFLFDDDHLSEVPILCPASINYIQPNTLVRFRGMIQDMLGNEFYVGAYKDGAGWRTNKYSDVSQQPMEWSSDMKLWERRLLYCVPVPGLNSWTESSETIRNQCRNLISQQKEKRQRECDEAIDQMELAPNHECKVSPCSKKMREECHTSSSGMQHEPANYDNFPSIAWENESDIDSFPCLVKVYDSPESDLKLNGVVEFVGVLSYDLEVKLGKDNSAELSNDLCEDEVVHLPPKVPHIHCIIHRKLGSHDFLLASPMTEPKPSLIRGIREGLLVHLAAILGNDGLAAQCLLLHLLSRVHARVDTVAVGKLSFNLTCFSKQSALVFGNQLILAVKNLLPFTHNIALTVDYLNSAALGPKKDYERNRLVSGVLQLAEGSHLAIDETQLQTGTLNSTGVENTRLLKNLIELQQVEYDFQYYKMEMATDIQLLVLSEGKSNILPADLVLPFRPSSACSLDMPDGGALQAWRWYFATLRSLPHTISPEMQKVVEEDLVATRQADRSLGTVELSRLLTMGRLMSLSFGETSLSLEHWQMVKELERLRKERLK